MSTAEDFVERIKRLIECGDVERGRTLATRALRWFPHEPKLYRLLGVAEGNLGNHEGAKWAFVETLNLTLCDYDLSNLLTSLLALEEVNSAIEIMETEFPRLQNGAKLIVARSLNEALRIGTVHFMKLPVCVQIYLKERHV